MFALALGASGVFAHGDASAQSGSAAPSATVCTDGRVRDARTAGHCCWPEQRWSRSRSACAGTPSCPGALVERGDECIAREPVAPVAPVAPVVPVVTAPVVAQREPSFLTAGTPGVAIERVTGGLRITGPLSFADDGTLVAMASTPSDVAPYPVHIAPADHGATALAPGQWRIARAWAIPGGTTWGAITTETLHPSLSIGDTAAPGTVARVVVGGSYFDSLDAVDVARDGHTLALAVHADSNAQVFAVDVEHGAVTLVAEGSAPRFSTDGARIAYETTSLDADAPVVAIVGRDGHDARAVAYGTAPRFSPDGSALTFVAPASGGHTAITVAELGATATVRALTVDESADDEALFTPDGASVIFTSDREIPGDDHPGTHVRHIWRVRRDGTGATPITHGHASDSVPAFASDGFLYFVRADGESRDLWRLRMPE